MPVSGYVPLPLVTGESADGQPIKHYVYLRQHQARSDDGDQGAVFVANLPNDTTLDNIRDVCRACGDVLLEDFAYQGNNRGLVRLVDSAASARFLKKAARLAKGGDLISWETYGPRGADAYAARNQARFPSESVLQQQVDEFMNDFDQREEAAHAEDADQPIDADGFVLVRSKRKLPAEVGPPSKKKKRSLEKSDFYRFQLREQRKQEMNTLLRRYQDDKAKVEELKQKKKLRPY